MLDVKTTSEKKLTTVEVSGEVDLYSSPDLRKVLLDLTGSKTATILVDLGKVRYMDSSGVATLVEALQQVGAYGGNLKLANLRDAVKDVFELSRLDKVFDIYPTVADAKKSE